MSVRFKVTGAQHWTHAPKSGGSAVVWFESVGGIWRWSVHRDGVLGDGSAPDKATALRVAEAAFKASEVHRG